MDVRSADETGDATNVADLTDLVIEVGPATFNATVQVEASVDGSTFNDLGSAFTNAGGLLEITSAFKTVRTTTSGYTAGALTGIGAGRDSRTDV